MDNRIGRELSNVGCNFLPSELCLIAAARHIEWVSKSIISLHIALAESGIDITQSNMSEEGLEPYSLLDVHGSLGWVYQVLLNTTPAEMATKHLRETTNPAAWN